MEKREKIVFLLFRLTTIATVGVMITVLAILWRASEGVITWDFLTKAWSHRDITSGGIFPAIIGSIYISIGVSAVSFLFGIGTAIFLTEYRKQTWYRRMIQLAIRNLAGVPSVVYGLFGLAAFVQFSHFGTSLVAAILTLSIMTIPWIITASVEAFEAVPQRFREASLALGASQWQTIRYVALPAAIPGCITGGIVGIARALGETAPLIMVGATFYLSALPSSPFDKFMALPYHAFILASQHSSPHAASYAAATALVLIALTFLLSGSAIFIRYIYRKQREW